MRFGNSKKAWNGVSGLRALLMLGVWLQFALPSAQAAAADPFKNADTLFSNGRLKAAATLYEQALADNPASARVEAVTLRLAETAYALDQGDAVARYRAFLRRFGYADSSGRARYDLAASPLRPARS